MWLIGDGVRKASVWDRRCSWARRCRIGPFVEPGRAIKRHRPAIGAVLEHGLSNALIESANTKIRLITRIAFGFKDPAALIALAMLSRRLPASVARRITFMTHG